eukprot:5297299-Amphidinium_carterae.1
MVPDFGGSSCYLSVEMVSNKEMLGICSCGTVAVGPLLLSVYVAPFDALDKPMRGLLSKCET